MARLFAGRGYTSTITLGPVDNRALELRPDVLTYTTEPLTEPTEIVGPVKAELFVGSSRPHTDFFARLCDVDEKKKSVNITDGILRLTDATEDPRHRTIDLWPTAHRFAACHRIRLQVSSGAHPRYPATRDRASPWRPRRPCTRPASPSITTRPARPPSSCQKSHSSARTDRGCA
jgi:putative CocE/NonD family hydrolase